MKIRLDNKFNAFPNKTILGYVGETNARTITFSGLSVSGANSYSMIIDYGDGENYEVNIVDGVYTVDASVLKRPGLVNCQVLAKALSEDGATYTIVKKSNIFALNIGKSIDPGAIPTYEQATSAVEKLIQINPNANDVLKFTEQIDQNVDDIAELSGSVEELGDLVYIPENLYKDGDVTLTGNGEWVFKNINLDVSSVSDKPITVSLESVDGAEYKHYCLVQFRDASNNLLGTNHYLNADTMSYTYENTLSAKLILQLYRSQGAKPTTSETVFHGISVIAGETEPYIKKEYIDKSVEEIVTPMLADVGNPQAKVMSSSLESMTSGNTIVLNAPDVKKGKTISFSCNITEMGAVRLSHCDRFAYCSAVIEITASNVNYYIYGTELTLSKSVEHGLTIQDFLGVSIDCPTDKLGGNNACKVTVVTTSGNFVTELPFNGSRDNVKANVVSGTYTNCVLSFFCDDYKKDVWAFGDSYFDMWPVQSVALGYGNFLIDGWSGRASGNAYASLEKLLALYPSPKKILWCMGMNDADTTTAVNASWENYYNKLNSLCDGRNIELILTTIPNVPNRNHTFKNEIVRASGKRYVDIDKAVGAYENSAWYDGLLGGDNVHPTTRGQYVIASAIMASVPEIMAGL